MIKNVKTKKILKESIFKVITVLNKLIPKNDTVILLHIGNKGISFNLDPIRKYLLDHKYHKRYKIICSVESAKYFEQDGLTYVTHLQAINWFMKAKHVLYTAGQLPIKPSKDQIVIHMNHGVTDYKTMGALTKIDNGDEFYFTYMIAASSIYVSIEAKEYRCPESCIKICGEPMVDRLLKPHRMYKFDTYKKTLLWVPTFRQSDYLGYNDSDRDEFLPLFENNQYDDLNELLRKYECQIIVKLHPSQSVNGLKDKGYSNLKIFSHEKFIMSGMNLYDLMASVDGLIGDYSSASSQFLLTGKPLAYVIPDIDEYKEKRGFVFDNPTDYMPGKLIYTQNDFWDYIREFVSENDPYKEARERIKNIIHFYQDGNNVKRILEMSGIQ